MKKNRNRSFFIKFVILVVLLSLLTSCTDRGSAQDMLFNITKEFDDLPDGSVYLSKNGGDSENFLSATMINTLYHDGAAEYEFSMIEEYAIYISEFAKPCEVAIYKCYSRSDTNLIASMCLGRIEKLTVMLAGTSFAEIPLKADVDIKGHFVIVTMV